MPRFRTRRMSRRPRRRRRRRGRRRRLALDPERKDVAGTVVGQTISTAGAIFHINAANEGINPEDRIGRQALWLSATANMTFKMGTASGVPNSLRIWLIVDKNPNGVLITLADFLESPTAATISNRNLDNRNRFKVMWTRRFTMDADHRVRNLSFFKNFRIISRHSGGGAGIADVQNGAIYLIFASDQAADLPVLDFSRRVRFVG